MRVSLPARVGVWSVAERASKLFPGAGFSAVVITASRKEFKPAACHRPQSPEKPRLLGPREGSDSLHHWMDHSTGLRARPGPAGEGEYGAARIFCEMDS